MKNFQLNRFLYFCIFLLFLLQLSTFAQTAEPSPTPTDRENKLNEIISNLKKQKEIAELERDIAKAQKDSLEAAPKATSTPVKSDVVINGEEIETELVVYYEMNKVVGKLADSLRETLPKNSTMAIFNAKDFDDWKFYRQSFPLFKVIIEDLTESYCVLSKPSRSGSNDFKSLELDAAANLARSANLVGQVADFLGYLRTETKQTGKNVEIGESVLVSELFSKLRTNSEIKMLYPKTFSPVQPIFCGKKTLESKCCESGKENCTETREVYCSETANLFDDLYRARRKALENQKNADELKRLNKTFDEFNDLFSGKNALEQHSALEKYLNAELINQLQQQPDVYFLEMKTLKAVGSQRIRKNLFFLTDKLDYSGGIIIQWTLFDKDGNLKNSGVINSYGGFLSPKKMKAKN